MIHIQENLGVFICSQPKDMMNLKVAHDHNGYILEITDG